MPPSISPIHPRSGRALLGAWMAALLVAAAGRAELRDLNSDRPDQTESPYTVDAGHWQVEMDLVSQTRNRLDGVTTREWDVAPFNLRFGISDRVEAGVFFAPYSRVTTEGDHGARFTVAGAGDLTLRAKFNFFGDDGGRAFGLITDVKLPTAAAGLGNGAVEGDIALPFACTLPGDWDLGVMTELDLRHRDGGGLRAVSVNSVTLGHDLCRNFSGYLELTSAAGDGAHVATFDFGVAWKVNANTQFDAGANVGISRTADDLRVFTGVTRRF